MIKNLNRAAAAGMLAAALVASGASAPATASTSTVAAAPEAPEAKPGDVKITVVGINAPGKDARWNRNREYVWIKNVSAGEVNVFGWTLRDGYGQRYTFDKDELKDLNPFPDEADTLMLPAGESVLIYTGSGTDRTVNGTHSVYLDRSGHYINNSSGEDLQVRNQGGDVMDRLRFDAYGINPTP